MVLITLNDFDNSLNSLVFLHKILIIRYIKQPKICLVITVNPENIPTNQKLTLLFFSIATKKLNIYSQKINKKLSLALPTLNNI